MRKNPLILENGFHSFEKKHISLNFKSYFTYLKQPISLVSNDFTHFTKYISLSSMKSYVSITQKIEFHYVPKNDFLKFK